jgi:hypothetical protein
MDKNVSDPRSQVSGKQRAASKGITAWTRENRPRSACTNESQVGIIFYAHQKLFIDSTPLTQAPDYGDFKIHDKGHDAYWEELLLVKAVPAGEYDEYPRGRVVHDTRKRSFIILLDKCILERKGLLRKIVDTLHLPAAATKVDTDDHYRCPGCVLRKSEPERH